MITQEKIQVLLDDLRCGKYNTDRYDITIPFDHMLSIFDTQNKSFIEIKCVKPKAAIIEKTSRFNLCKPKITPKTIYTVNIFIGDNKSRGEWIMTEVDYSLFSSFEAYINECIEKYKADLKSKIKKGFGL